MYSVIEKWLCFQKFRQEKSIELFLQTPCFDITSFKTAISGKTLSSIIASPHLRTYIYVSDEDQKP